MKRLYAFMAVLMLSASVAMAAPRTKTEMQRAARQAINKHRAAQQCYLEST